MLRLRVEHNTTGERLPHIPGGLDWSAYGLEPRWLGTETSDCAVALEPSSSRERGADALGRFLDGARQRSELALMITVIGNAEDDLPGSRSSVPLGETPARISGRRLPAGTRSEIAADLSAADLDLAKRLRNRPASAPWWSMQLSGTTVSQGGVALEYEAEGRLHPILADGLGDPIAGAWTPPTGGQRWYVIPDATDWESILGWLTQQAMPEYVPAALRRARSPYIDDPGLQTAAERAARQALVDLEARYSAEKLSLEQDLRGAQTRAEPVREGLLYGTGSDLVHAVAEVLTAAGLRAVDLDEELGGTGSADLLISDGASRRLVEVKAVGGAATENMVGALQRHLSTWPELRPSEPVSGGVLVVNHHHKRYPSERPAEVYHRRAFVDSLNVTVVSTLDLFHWWRNADWVQIRAALMASNPGQAAPTNTPEAPSSNAR